METLMQYLPILIPIVVIQYILAIVALIHLLKHPHYRFGNKIIWILVVLFVQFIGPILYFTVGRREE